LNCKSKPKPRQGFKRLRKTNPTCSPREKSLKSAQPYSNLKSTFLPTDSQIPWWVIDKELIGTLGRIWQLLGYLHYQVLPW
jgi:hypothetical protein